MLAKAFFKADGPDAELNAFLDKPSFKRLKYPVTAIVICKLVVGAKVGCDDGIAVGEPLGWSDGCLDG